MHSVSVGAGHGLAAASKGTVKALDPQRLQTRAPLKATQRRVVYAAPAAGPPSLMGELRRRFKPEVEALSAIIWTATWLALGL